MIDVDKTIEAFRKGTLEFDCKQIMLAQRKHGGERFEGQGYIRQVPDGTLTFKIYVVAHNAKPFGHFETLLGIKAGKIYSDEAFYDLEATGHDGTSWTATRILPKAHWDASDVSVLVDGRIQSITADLDMPQPRHCLRLHFFEEYEVPLHLMSEVGDGENRWMVRDRAVFNACGSSFDVRKREGSDDTVVDAVSESPFPPAFDLRIQEALQYLTAKTAIWRARLQSQNNNMHLELASPWRRSPRTQFSPPISPASTDFHLHGWRLFGQYLAYMVTSAQGTYWNPVAYHLNNACEATAGSLDARAVGVSVALEAVASLIRIEADKDNAERVADLQKRMLQWLAQQPDLEGLAERVRGQINALSNKRPQDILHALAATGHVEEGYIKAWSYLRNRHVHPTLSDLKKRLLCRICGRFGVG